MQNENRRPSDDQLPHHDNKQIHQSRLHNAFKAQEELWRTALEEDHRDLIPHRRTARRKQLQKPCAAVALLVVVSILIVGPSTSVGQRVHHEISHTMAQLTVLKAERWHGAVSPALFQINARDNGEKAS